MVGEENPQECASNSANRDLQNLPPEELKKRQAKGCSATIEIACWRQKELPLFGVKKILFFT